MTNFKLLPIDIENDKPQIAEWDSAFALDKNYSSIFEFILENGQIRGLAEIIETNYEHFPIGKTERKFTFVAKSDEGEILGFMIMSAFDVGTSKPELFIQYVVVNPLYHHQNVGTNMLEELFSNFKKHIGVKPKNIFAYIHKNNIPSKHLFKHFGFELGDVPRSEFSCATVSGKDLKQNLEAQNQRI